MQHRNQRTPQRSEPTLPTHTHRLPNHNRQRAPRDHHRDQQPTPKTPQPDNTSRNLPTPHTTTPPQRCISNLNTGIVGFVVMMITLVLPAVRLTLLPTVNSGSSPVFIRAGDRGSSSVWLKTSGEKTSLKDSRLLLESLNVLYAREGCFETGRAGDLFRGFSRRDRHRYSIRIVGTPLAATPTTSQRPSPVNRNTRSTKQSPGHHSPGHILLRRATRGSTHRRTWLWCFLFREDALSGNRRGPVVARCFLFRGDALLSFQACNCFDELVALAL